MKENLNGLFVSRKLAALPEGLLEVNIKTLPNPLDPSVYLLGLDRCSKIFKSKMLPVVVDMHATYDPNGGADDAVDKADEESSSGGGNWMGMLMRESIMGAAAAAVAVAGPETATVAAPTVVDSGMKDVDKDTSKDAEKGAEGAGGADEATAAANDDVAATAGVAVANKSKTTTTTTTTSTSISKNKQQFIQKLFFKQGDDLRTDQLIINMFTLMDSLLKKVNLDLKMRM